VAMQIDTMPAGLEPSPAGTVGPPRRTRGGMTSVVVRRLIGAFFSVVAVIVFNFFLFRLLPGDPARNLGRNRHLSAEQMANLRDSWGLDEPLPQQFLHYLDRLLLHGDLGISLAKSQAVTTVISEKIWATVLLVGTSTILSTVIGLWIGIKGAWERGSRFDRLSNAASLTLYAMPEFWLGIVLLMLVAGNQIGLGLFPTGGIHSPDVTGGAIGSVVDVGYHLFLPCLTLTLAYLAEYSLVMRSSLLDEMGQDYLQTARAKGLRDTSVRRRHAVPNALLPTITLIFLNFGFVISGALTVEYVFSWPGLGSLAVEALSTPDFPLLQGVFLLFAASTIMFNLVADLMLGVLDPRVREA